MGTPVGRDRPVSQGEAQMSTGVLSTYRIQFNRAFTLKDALTLVDYLWDLGISHIYTSPLFRASKGSTHGYDVVCPEEINPDLGTLQDLRALAESLRIKGMGIILDIVPNHMAYSGENPYLMDVFENGPASKYYNFFDIEWDHTYEDLKGRVLAPFLGSPFSEALLKGEIRLEIGREGFFVRYYDLKLPLRVESYERILTYRLQGLRKLLPEDHPEYIKFLGMLYFIRSLPGTREETPQRQAQVGFIKRLLWELYCSSSAIREFIDDNLRVFNGQKDNPESFKHLETLLEEQFFRLSYWKVATEEINYRRFFNINGLICVRQQDEGVFAQYHGFTIKLCQEGLVQGLRVDHIDGLYEPTRYLQRLRDATGTSYIVVEKILEPEESLPGFWPVEGTTGYDALYWINGLFVMKKNRRAFDRVYQSFTALRTPYQEVFYEKKRLIIEKEMMGDMDNLARLLKRLSAKMRYGRDFTIYGLKEALIKFLAHLPVYRTYIDEEHYRPYDRLVIDRTIKTAKDRDPELAHELDFLGKVLAFSEETMVAPEEVYHFIKKLQQFTGPLMAKGFEDTLLYVYNRLQSLNEVGGAPQNFGVSLKEFHSFMKRRASAWPMSMTTTSTHDTKRGEDARARLNVLSEIPEQWKKHLQRWRRRNERYSRMLRGRRAPDPNEEYLLYQNLIASLPFKDQIDRTYMDRIKQFMLKALREAKVHTSWVNPDGAYEEAVMGFVDGVLSDKVFLKDLMRFKNRVAFYGMLNSLAQVVLKCTLPGVVDIYQGAELWDLSLVDPDNRRPVDFSTRRRYLKEIGQNSSPEYIKSLLQQYHDGRIKMFVLHRSLRARSLYPEVFLQGRYIPLRVKGPRREHVIAFAREYKGKWAVVVAGRFFTSLVRPNRVSSFARPFKGTSVVLPDGVPQVWEEAISGHKTKTLSGELPLERVLRMLPVAVLVGGE